MNNMAFIIRRDVNDNYQEFITIKAIQSEGFECGIIITDCINDIFTLRNSIDTFLEKHQIQRIDMTDNNKKRETVDQLPFCTIVSGYLWGIDVEPAGNVPDNFDHDRSRVITSQEIVLALADMADLELNDVARCMAHLGYRCGSMDGKIGWLVQRIKR